MKEIPEMNSYFQGINRSSLFYSDDTTTNFVLYIYVVIGNLIKDSFLHSGFIGLNTFQRCSWHILQSKLTEQEKEGIKKKKK